jgi:hypothetical protein
MKCRRITHTHTHTPERTHYIRGYFVFPKAILEHIRSFVGRKQSYEINIPSATSLLSTFERGDLSKRNAVGRLCHWVPPTKQYSQFPPNLADTHLKGGSNTCDTKDLPKILNFKKALFLFLERKHQRGCAEFPLRLYGQDADNQ